MKRVLVIEDDPDIVELLSYNLERQLGQGSTFTIELVRCDKAPS